MSDKKEPRGNSATGSRPNPVTGCPLTAALAAVGGKWKMIIIYWLAEEPTHFAGPRRKMSSISQKVLTQQLREHSVLPLVESVRRWGRQHLENG
jgi:DNA-binding HxlR family transcriptional regulator